MNKEASRKRIEHLREWVVELYREAGPERQRLDSRTDDNSGSILLGAIEVFFGDWSPWTARVVAGRSIPDSEQLVSQLQRSVLDVPGVWDFFLKEGQFEHVKRYIEGVESLRLALLTHLTKGADL